MTRSAGRYDPDAQPADTRADAAATDAAPGISAAEASGPIPIVLRRMTHADIDGGLRLCRASNWNQIARDWEHFLTVNPEGARVLAKGDHIVGTVTSLRYGRFGWLAMVLVDPAERGRGFGSRLLGAGLELLADLPSARLDATPAGEGLYRARGFREEGRFLRMARPGDMDGRHAVSADVRPMRAADLARIAEWDAAAFGADRRMLLEWLYLGTPEYAWIADGSGEITGYLFGRHGFNAHHLGPVVARDDGIAMQLVSTCLASHGARGFVIDANAQSPAFIGALQTHGFREQRPFVRMALGPDRFGLPEFQFASAGPELG